MQSDGVEPCPTADEVTAQVRRIAQSSRFVGSEPVRSLLLYLAEHAGESTTEYELATEVLGRGPDFDPRLDSGVRVSIGRLRSRLAEYYLHEGAEDRILVDFPKGRYALISGFRPSAGGPTANRHRPSLRSLTLPLTILGCILAGGLAGWFAGRSAGSAPAPHWATRLFWAPFLTHGRPLIIYSNPLFTGTAETSLKLLGPNALQSAGTSDIYTGTGEAAAVGALTAEFVRLGIEPRLKRALLFTWDEAANSNLILLGGQVQNVVVAQLPQLQKFNIKTFGQEPMPTQSAIRNEHVEAGEQAYYFSSRDANNGTVYAIVALTPGAFPGRSVLVLAGTNTRATEAAARFVCTPSRLEHLLARLNLRPGMTLMPFEAVLRVPQRGGIPLDAELLDVHRRR